MLRGRRNKKGAFSRPGEASPKGCDRGDEDNGPPIAHVRVGLFDQQHRRLDVDVEELVDGISGGVHDAARRRVHGCVGYEDVDAAVFLSRTVRANSGKGAVATLLSRAVGRQGNGQWEWS